MRLTQHISQITDHLYIGSRRGAEKIEVVRQLDVRLIINMIGQRRPARGFASLPAEILWLRTFDFPLLPIPVEKLARGVEAALPVIQGGRGVLVYCEGGRHRSVAMASAILIGLGYSADEAMKLVCEGREVADPWAWHIQRQIRKFEAYWPPSE
ncbi:MAG TPA: dual specificity protein phosphatase [Anaerolineae bacterium]|nr:dual specificity protein phosphatase [Anaerolineae bacterium]